MAADGDLFGTTSFGIARSHDGGATWDPPLPVDYLAPVKPRDRIARLVASVVPGRLLAAGAVGFWASNDHGATWTASNQGIAAHGAWSVAVSPVGPPTVLAIAGASVFRSTDAGASWLRLHSALDGVQPFSIAAFDPRDPRAVYGSGSDGQADFITASTDGGGTWSQLPVPYECGGDSVCEVGMSLAGIDPGEPRTLFVAGHYFFHFIGMGDFLLKSDDPFATWTPLTPLHRLGSLLVDTEQADSLYGLTCTGLRHSRDGGKTWQKTGRGLPKALCPQSGGLPTLVRDPLHPRTFYAATLTRGVFMSTDGGATFRSISRGLEKGWITTLLIDPQEPSRLYAGVAGKGVFRWIATGARWLPLNQGLPVRDYFGDLALDPQKPTRLYAAHPVHGLLRLDLDATEL